MISYVSTCDRDCELNVDSTVSLPTFSGFRGPRGQGGNTKCHPSPFSLVAPYADVCGLKEKKHDRGLSVALEFTFLTINRLTGSHTQTHT